MARVNYQEAQEIASKGGNFEFSFLSLKSGESKRVRFLHSSMEDIPSYTVHSVAIHNGEKTTNKNVDCLRATNEPVQKCPFCSIANKTRARVYLSLVDENTHELIVWERSAQFLTEMEGYFKRYGDLRDYVFDIERKGEGLNTTYTLYPIGPSVINDKSVLPAIPDVYGKLILDKTAEEMAAFINTGFFPDRVNPSVNQDNNQFVRREVNTAQQEPNKEPNYTVRDSAPRNMGWN